MAEERKNIKEVFTDAECVSDGLSQLVGQVGDKFVIDEEGKVTVSFELGIELASLTWESIKANAFKCYGKEIKVALPDTFTGRLLGGVLSFLGFKL